MGEIADALIDQMFDFDIDYDWFDEDDAYYRPHPPPGYAQPGKIAAPTDFPDCSIVPRSVVLELI